MTRIIVIGISGIVLGLWVGFLWDIGKEAMAITLMTCVFYTTIMLTGTKD